MTYGPSIVPEEDIKRSEALNDEIMSNPGIQKAHQELESTLLHDDFRYSPQIPIIKDCLKEAFGENIKYIRIVNRFLLAIEDLMESKHNLELFKGEKGLDRFKKLEELYEFQKGMISKYFDEYGAELTDRLQAENPGKTFEQIVEMQYNMEKKFIELLLQKLEYVFDKKN